MKSGFSLVELSIVLVILGLLTGGILAGQNLIRAAELRSVTTEVQKYQTAVYTFRDKYFALPGDMKNATSFWGEVVSGGSCNTATVGTGTQTCNGDADGTVFLNYGGNKYSENFTFWQHMANAGLIEGTYTGRAGSLDGAHALVGVNVPKGKISSSGWNVEYFDGVANAWRFVSPAGNVMRFGKEVAAGGAAREKILTPEELWNIDTKTDDGKPGRGKVLAHYWDDCTDATANTQLDAKYLLTVSSVVCGLTLLIGF